MAERTLVHVTNDVVRKKEGASTVVTASRTFTAADSGGTFDIGTDALVMTLPLIDASTRGMVLVFRNVGADGNNIITISPNAADGIEGTVANAAADSVASGVVNKDIVNTKATANDGDYLVLRAAEDTKWRIIGGVGIWASEA
jgi:hypothetical protein